ncbi:hypothetical protein WJX84_008522 [Apatococcus fuscideae]|uniref:Agmatine deiminase n=1 Tax=Apatococcus fuscideae TaxID=2026836 RepID=A0AAW1SK58_9CHLO
MDGKGWGMPAEWEAHTGCWIGWPYRSDNWRQAAGPAQRAFATVVKAIAQFEHVTVGARAEEVQAAKLQLGAEAQIVVIPFDDAWFRDTGPTFVRARDGTVAGVDWDFNAYGGLYPDYEQDKLIASNILKAAGVQRLPCPLVLEGGSIHVDGQGTLLTTEECLLNTAGRVRNPDLSRAQIEGLLRQMLGVRKIIWLPRGLYADEDTNGHVDNFACFAAPGKVLLAWTDDESDPQFERSCEALKILQSETDAQGRRLKVTKLHLPDPLFRTAEELPVCEGDHTREAGERLAASYVNFYIANGGIVMPAFGQEPADSRAWNTLVKTFPNRKVVSVPTREILLGGGNIHCITQQQPM